jgi:hypothetical protein
MFADVTAARRPNASFLRFDSHGVVTMIALDNGRYLPSPPLPIPEFAHVSRYFGVANLGPPFLNCLLQSSEIRLAYKHLTSNFKIV